MDLFSRLWKQLEDLPSSALLAGGAIVVVLITAFIVTVRNDRESRRQRELWTALSEHEHRKDPAQPYYISQDDLKMIEQQANWMAAMAEQQAQDPRDKQRRYQQAREYVFQTELSRRLYSNAGAVDRQLAEVSEETVKTLENVAMAQSHSKVGPWIYYHLGTIYLAKKRYDDADRVIAEARRALESQGAEGHVLTDPNFKWLDELEQRAKGQREWGERLAKREATRPKPLKGNPVLELTTTRGPLSLELLVAEAPEAVRRIAQLVASGYYDGRPFYELDGQLGLGSPYDAAGRTQLGDAVTAPISDRAHGKGTVSLVPAEHAVGEARFAPARLMVCRRDPASGMASFGGYEVFDGRYAVIGLVKAGDEVLDKLDETDRILRATFVEPGDLAGELDLVRWPTPSAASDKPAGEGTPPGEGDKPPGEGDKPPGEGDKPPGEGDKPPGEGDKPPGEGDKPPGEGDKPPGEGDKPPAEGEKPSGR